MTTIQLDVSRDGKVVHSENFERETIKIGRLASAHLRLEDEAVFRIHAVIEVLDGGKEVSIVDMGSPAGTLVNGEKIRRHRLNSGDVIRIADYEIVCQVNISEVQTELKTKVANLEEVEAQMRQMEDATKVVDVNQNRASDPFLDQHTQALAEDSIVAEINSLKKIPSQEGAPVAAAAPQVESRKAVPLDTVEDNPVEAGDFGKLPQANRLSATEATGSLTLAQSNHGLKQATSKKLRSREEALSGPALPHPDDTNDREISSERRVAEVTLYWGSDVATVRRFEAVSAGGKVKKDADGSVVIGTSDDADIFVPVEALGAGEAHTLLVQQPGVAEWDIRISPQMSGSVSWKGETFALQDFPGLKHTGRPDSITLRDGMIVQLSFGHFTTEIRHSEKARVVPFIPYYDTMFLNTMMITLFAMLFTIGGFMFTLGELGDGEDDLMSNLSEFESVILEPPEKDVHKATLDGGGEKSKAYKDEQGKAGKKKAKPNKKNRMAIKGEKRDNKALVSQKMAALFGGGPGATGLLKFDGDADGSGEMMAALGNITGSQIGDAHGNGGIGLSGNGAGGGGDGTGTIGIGNVGTRGMGGGNGSGYGGAGGGFGGKKYKNVGVSVGKPKVRGSMDAAIIKRIVREHMNEIRYCYEKELNRNPGLFGKIIMNWTIGPTGSVLNARKAASQMNNAAVEGCMARKIKRWKFPRPKGGGEVVVNYPFVFKPSN